MRITLLVIAAALFSAGCNQTPAPAAAEVKAPDTKAKDIADIKALEDRFVAAFKAKDVKTIMTLYVPDESLVAFDATPPRQFVGAAAYAKDWEDFMSSYPGAFDAELTDLDITVGGGDVAYSHSIQHTSGTLKTGKKLDVTVRVTDGYKRVNGQWLIAHEHVSVPVDIATGKADLTSKP